MPFRDIFFLAFTGYGVYPGSGVAPLGNPGDIRSVAGEIRIWSWSKIRGSAL